MLSKLKDKKFWLNVLKMCCIGIIGCLSSILLVLTDLFKYNTEIVEDILKENATAIITTLISAGFFTFVITIIAYLVGKKFYSKVVSKPVEVGQKEKGDSKKVKILKKDLIILLCVGIFVPLILYLFDIFVYSQIITDFVSIKYTFMNLISTILYNGLIEEIWFRYGLMCFIIYSMYKVFNVKKDKNKIDKKYIIIGAVFTSMLLFIFQLNAIADLYGSNIFTVIRAFLNYFVMDVVYSYFCVKYGIKWSIFIHILFIFFYVGIYPIIFTLIL